MTSYLLNRFLEHQDSYAAQQAAEGKGVLSIGSPSDMRRAAPNANLTSSTTGETTM